MTLYGDTDLGQHGGVWQSAKGSVSTSVSTLTQVMACCLMAPSHYMNKCWFIISRVQRHSFEGHFTRYSSHQSIKLAWKWLIWNYFSNSQGSMSQHTEVWSNACMCHWTGSSLVQVMAYHQFRTKPSPHPMHIYCQLDPQQRNFDEIWIKTYFSFNKIYLQMLSAMFQPCCSNLSVRNMTCLLTYYPLGAAQKY